MPKRKNLIGQKFNHLTVIELDLDKTQSSGRTHWICECDCEDKTRLSVSACNLQRGNSTKCKYCRAENLIGKQFNQLTVIKRIITDEDKVEWLCQCSCGNTKIIRADSLKSGHTQSCGCLQKKHISELNFKNLIGQRFGKLVVTNRSQKKDTKGQYYWFCKCDCGSVNLEISGHNLVAHRTISCGCIRSKGEEKIASILKENNIPFIREYILKDCTLTTGGHPRMDFAILNKNNEIEYFIEYQGEQHYYARGDIFTDENVKKIQQRDKEKLAYCNSINIPIKYIKYTDFNTLTINNLII